VQQAVARLGLLKVREIVIVIACQCRIFNVPGFDADVRESFKRSLATAVFAQETARTMRQSVEESFLSGLLHDVGRPILLQALVDRRESRGLRADDDELRVAADTNRIPLATRLVELWELPERTADAINDQLSPLESELPGQGAAVLNLAMDLARVTLRSGAPPTPDTISHPMIDVLNLYPEQVQAVLDNHEQVLDWVNSTV
jgi:HD-like signal output (HDOD) protein